MLSDLNSLAGIYYVHPTYENLTPTQISSATLLPGSESLGTPNSLTNYYMIPTANLPLLDPLRAIPVVGNPLADLMQPDLTYLVNMGYGNPLYGYPTGPANVPTPFGLFPPLSSFQELPGLLASGAGQGVQNFIGDFTGTGPNPVALPSLSSLTGPSSGPSVVSTMLPSPAELLSALSPVSVADDVYNAVNALSLAASDAYSTLLPTAYVANALLTTLPAYDLTLFAAGLQSGNLLEAIGQPIATDAYLIPLAGAFELFAVVGQAQTVIGDL